MAFILIGQGINNPVPLQRLFPARDIEQIEEVAAKRAIDEAHRLQHEYEDDVLAAEQRMAGAARAASAYREAEEVAVENLQARQIMNSPVVSVTAETTADEVLQLFQAWRLRHLPVVSDETGGLIGMISDRDLLRHFGGITDEYRRTRPRGGELRVTDLMHSPVLTADPATDVRYIARLFVERHIGAMPIIENGALAGIITRNDLLGAVMRHFVLELWA